MPISSLDKACPCEFGGYFYRPKRSFGQGNIFTSMCHSVHRGEYLTRHTPCDQAGTPPRTRQVHPPDQAGTPPDQAGTPPGQVHPPDQVHPPWTRYPPGQVHPPQAGTLPPDQVHPHGRYTPPDQTPPWTRQVPSGPGTPPGPGRYTPGPDTPPDQVHPPGLVHPPRPGRYIPWTRQVHPSPLNRQTPEYGQCSAGMHPTGMHSCWLIHYSTGFASFLRMYLIQTF